MIASRPIAATVPANVHLRLTQVVAAGDRCDMSRAARLLAAPELPWLGELVEHEVPPGARRFHVDLGLATGAQGARAVLRKAAYVDLASPSQSTDGIRVPIEWRASSMAPLFPVFAGHLTVAATSLVLEGDYAPPGGEIGFVADRALLNIAARRTAVWFLRLVAAALAEGCDPDEDRPA